MTNYQEYSVVFQGFLQNTHTDNSVSQGFPRPSQSHIRTENIVPSTENTLKSQDLAGHLKKPQETNSNLNELQPFTAFQQTKNQFGSPAELPKSSLEIDLGPVLPQTTSEDIENFFSPPIAELSPRPFFTLGEAESSDLVDDKMTTSNDFLSQTDNDQHQSTPAVALGSQDNREIEIPALGIF